ncbi:MAG: hypothetical protein CL824_00315 [Crocinitomicaceae bacterium]|nr:hypothetical protein [Crocinitomicaceae bacterium]
MKPAKQTFKRNISNIAKEKLNKHREMGTDSPFSIIEVAQMLDVVNSKSSKETEAQESIFFSVSLN